MIIVIWTRQRRDSIELKNKGKNICCLELWDYLKIEQVGIKITKLIFLRGSFFSSSFQKVIDQNVQCFSLIHAIAHFR